MLIQTHNAITLPKAAPVRQSATPAQPESSTPTETFTPSGDAKPKELNPPWAHLANGAIVAGAVGIPSLIAAAGAATIGPLATGIALPLVAGAGAGYMVIRSSKKDNFPVVATVLGAGLAAGIATVASPFLAFPGATWGVKGALIAAGALGGLAGIATAVAVAKDNEKIRAHNAKLGL